MISYPVVNTGLGQSRQYITTDDFRGYVNQANSSMKAVADIAKAHGLSEEESRAVDSEVGKVAGYTIPMAETPKGAPIAAAPSGPPLLAVAAAAIIAGGLAGHFLL